MIKVKWQHTYRKHGGNGNGNGNGGHTSNSRGSSGGSLTISPVIDGVTNLSLARRPVGTIWYALSRPPTCALDQKMLTRASFAV